MIYLLKKIVFKIIFYLTYIYQSINKIFDQLRPKKYTLFGQASAKLLPVFTIPQRVALPKKLNDLPEVIIATPLKDASLFLPTYFSLIKNLDYPTKKIHLRFLEGDSKDTTFSIINDWLQQVKKSYASGKLLKHDLQNFYPGPRSNPVFQRKRRSSLAVCRNLLLNQIHSTKALYVLFVDVDLITIPPQALSYAISYNAPIIIANCLLEKTLKPFDLNTFCYTTPPSDYMIEKYSVDGIYQPPVGYFRTYPQPNHKKNCLQVHSVGGTFLLIHRRVITAGINFPEEPYRYHLETEGFALKAADRGFGSFILPNLVVHHKHH